MSEPSAAPALIRVWRLVKERHADNAFDGEGARVYGGRWNSSGYRAVYTSSSLALASLEILVHLDAAMPLPRLVAFSVELSPSDITTASLPAISYASDQLLPPITETRRIGDEWLTQNRYLALSVPSVIIPQESNIILNPLHPNFARLPISAPAAFSIDGRLRR